MIYHVSARAGRGGDGTREKPFQTITEAAKIACAGDEVLGGSGGIPGVCESCERRNRRGCPDYLPLRGSAAVVITGPRW